MGGVLSRDVFSWRWRQARDRAGVPGLHFHDLRHLGLTLAAVAGATTRELMKRAGHASPRAALIYQHASEDRDAVIAAALTRLASTPPAKIAPPLWHADGTRGSIGRLLRAGHPRDYLAKALVAEADGNRTRLTEILGHTGFEDRCRPSAVVRFWTGTCRLACDDAILEP